MIKPFDTMFSGIANTVSPYLKIITQVVTAFFGVFIGLGVFGIIGVVLMTFCNKYSCRYLIYFICLILTILGILSFLLAILFSIITPVLYLSCDFINVTIGSQDGFSTNLQPILGTATNMIKVCLPGGTGDIIRQFNITITAIDSLQMAIDKMRLYDATEINNNLTAGLTAAQEYINKFYYAAILDFDPASNSGANLLLLKKVAKPSNYGCTQNSFSSDSWVPNINPDSTTPAELSCQASGTHKVSTIECNTQNKIKLGASGTGADSGCYGCMDTYKILSSSVAGNPLSNIEARYSASNTPPPAGACLTWYQDISNLWNNYYSKKNAYYSPVINRFAATKTRYDTDGGGYTAYKNHLTTIGTTISTAIESLEQMQNVFNPDTGLMAGLNCLVLG